MRSSAEMRPPGIYPVQTEPLRAPLTVADTRIAGFVGMTEKGPVDEPVCISNWDEFVEVYGYSTKHFTSDSVQAFFRNGGAKCYVVRVAHVPRRGQSTTVEHASSAEHSILDGWNKPAFRVAAVNEGRWGNRIWVRCTHATGARALLTRDLEIGKGEALVNTTRGFEVGALVRIFDRDHSDFVIISEVGERRICWSVETPVNRKHLAAAPTQLEVIEFELHIAMGDRREIFQRLQQHPSSRQYAPRVIERKSRLICLEDKYSTSPPSHRLPQTTSRVKLTGGRDGDEAVTPEDFVGYDHGPADRAGLMSLVEVGDVGLLACPDAMTFIEREPGPAGEIQSQRVQDAMIDLAENLRDRFVILDCPRTRDVDAVLRWRRRTDSSYCAYYWPWVKMANYEGEEAKELPPSGILAGIYAQRDTELGVHQAPANVSIQGATDLSVRVTEDHLGMLNAEAVNSFRIARGIRPWGARTASSDPDWRYISVRRLFIMLRRSVETGMSWVPFEPNNEDTWSKLHSLVSVFLGELFRKGMFAGGNPEDAFFVKCDKEVNPAEDVDQGRLTCEFGVAPASPAEFIMVQVVQNMGGE